MREGMEWEWEWGGGGQGERITSRIRRARSAQEGVNDYVGVGASWMGRQRRRAAIGARDIWAIGGRGRGGGTGHTERTDTRARQPDRFFFLLRGLFRVGSGYMTRAREGGLGGGGR